MPPDAPAELPFPELRQRFLDDPLSLLGRVPGIFPVDKPSGPTSHDGVDRLRRRLKMRRVGHGGTLDPMATGLLLLLAGNATRLFDELQHFPKTYRATLRLGGRTDSRDATGNPVAFTPTREGWPTADDWEKALAGFRGAILQIPPMHSALKKNGRPLYELARAGVEIEREPRPVTVHSLALAAADGPDAELVMAVSSGFYVRVLVDDLGLALGTGAVMTALRREAIGPFTLDHAAAW